MNEFEAIFDGELEGGGESDASYRGSLVFNVPVVEDKMALRVATLNAILSSTTGTLNTNEPR